MGKKKLASISLINDKNTRNVTYCKRKRGLIKKAIELSKLCNQYIYLVIFDREKQRFIEYNSHDVFDHKIISKLASEDYKTNFKYENYTNDNYRFFEKFPSMQEEATKYTDGPSKKNNPIVDSYAIDHLFKKNGENSFETRNYQSNKLKLKQKKSNESNSNDTLEDFYAPRSKTMKTEML